MINYDYSLPMENTSEIEEVIQKRYVLENKIKEQKKILGELDALKRTFVKSMVKEELYMGLPLSTYKQDKNFEIIKINDKYPFIVLNMGEWCGFKHQTTSELSPPINYKILRYFNKCRINKKDGENTWYTTTVLNKNEELYYIIKDDENNVWRGPNAFSNFSQLFDSFPFSDIKQWLGLDNAEINAKIRSQIIL